MEEEGAVLLAESSEKQDGKRGQETKVLATGGLLGLQQNASLGVQLGAGAGEITPNGLLGS